MSILPTHLTSNSTIALSLIAQTPSTRAECDLQTWPFVVAITVSPLILLGRLSIRLIEHKLPWDKIIGLRNWVASQHQEATHYFLLDNLMCAFLHQCCDTLQNIKDSEGEASFGRWFTLQMSELGTTAAIIHKAKPSILQGPPLSKHGRSRSPSGDCDRKKIRPSWRTDSFNLDAVINSDSVPMDIYTLEVGEAQKEAESHRQAKEDANKKLKSMEEQLEKERKAARAEKERNKLKEKKKKTARNDMDDEHSDSDSTTAATAATASKAAKAKATMMDKREADISAREDMVAHAVAAAVREQTELIETCLETMRQCKQQLARYEMSLKEQAKQIERQRLLLLLLLLNRLISLLAHWRPLTLSQSSTSSPRIGLSVVTSLISNNLKHTVKVFQQDPLSIVVWRKKAELKLFEALLAHAGAEKCWDGKETYGGRVVEMRLTSEQEGDNPLSRIHEVLHAQPHANIVVQGRPSSQTFEGAMKHYYPDDDEELQVMASGLRSDLNKSDGPEHHFSLRVRDFIDLDSDEKKHGLNMLNGHDDQVTSNVSDILRGILNNTAAFQCNRKTGSQHLVHVSPDHCLKWQIAADHNTFTGEHVDANSMCTGTEMIVGDILSYFMLALWGNGMHMCCWWKQGKYESCESSAMGLVTGTGGCGLGGHYGDAQLCGWRIDVRCSTVGKRHGIFFNCKFSFLIRDTSYTKADDTGSSSVLTKVSRSFSQNASRVATEDQELVDEY
ncbi:hypothetical protein BKA62DRAFT_674737 [Auriculariales sp. MPI-PUGE-AT-0066]|nr:hypothetical protein BKA62DRAFT_674737 [Auriculariales sp. MPI-PUGE-AT-0066]